MKPSKFCKAISCTDCKYYKECLENEYQLLEEQDKYSAIELKNKSI